MSTYPYSFEILDVGLLFVDDAYQRPLTSFATKIEKGYDPALVGTLVVSARTEGDQDGFYAIVDGQTRAAAIAALAARDEARCGVPCLVYRNLTQADEAKLFARLQKERRGISSYHRFRADLVAGAPEATAIQEITVAAGFEIGDGPNQIGAVAALENAYRRSPQTLDRTLRILRAAWGLDVTPPGDVIRGLGNLLAREDIEDLRLVDHLTPITVEALRRRASAIREGLGTGHESASRAIGLALETVYRNRLAAAA